MNALDLLTRLTECHARNRRTGKVRKQRREARRQKAQQQ